MHILWMLIIGLVAGALARLIMPSKMPGGIGLTMLLGLCGSFLAGFFGRAVGWYRTPGSAPGIIASLVGALILLGLYHFAVTRGLVGRDHHIDRPTGPTGPTRTTAG
jgi:uncharacterized membrane protein YeaQ/YmgE (transglycosylase-associated protein family)